MAESADPLKKSTKSESANCFPRKMIREIQSDFNCWSCLAWYCVLALWMTINEIFMTKDLKDERIHAGGRQLSSRPSRVVTLKCVTIASHCVTSGTWKRGSEIPGERWDPRSELLNNQNPQSGPKNWIKPRSAVIIGSADPFKSRSESRIRAKTFTKSTDP